MAEAPRGTGDRDNWTAAVRRQARFRSPWAGRRRDRVAQPWANLTLSLNQRATLPDNVGGRDFSILPERQP